MAGLAQTPTHLVTSVSKYAIPASTRRAPSQSMTSTPKSSIARPSLGISASSRTTLRAGFKALQHMQLAHNASAVASRTNVRVMQALGNNLPKNVSFTNRDQKKHDSKQQTSIPGPTGLKMIAKMRKYGAIKYKLYVKEQKSDIQECEEEGDPLIISDANPDLLHDESYDETRDPYEQSRPQTIFNRFQALHKVLNHTKGIIGRYTGAHISSYGGGNQFKLSRKRPRAFPAPRVIRGIPLKPGTTLEYRKIGHSPTGSAASANILEQIKAEKRFGFGFESCIELKKQQTLPTEPGSILGKAIISGVTKAHMDIVIDVAPKSSKTNSSEPIPSRKTVHFAEDPVKPLMYHGEACANDIKSFFEMGDDWTPIKLNTAYPGSSQATGFETMFIQTNRQSISLKRGSIDAGERPVLGQLEYGNADYMISLQVADIVTAHDIGTLVDPSEFNLPASICNGPLLHFGGFAQAIGYSFEDTFIPRATAVV
ncbi:hypothetical protein DE146DRAFT_772727 [Phaeosphaeria sp. MPI-PUGE-AT-0046c]|nr:hypothetical protein DE146DRAFT_772727 [Phaeosphaeria sp. MPI-PUGE-AT-0046c]